MNQALMGDFLGSVSQSRTQSGINGWSVSMTGDRITSGSQSQSGIRGYNLSISGSRMNKGLTISYSGSKSISRCRSRATTKK